MAKKEGTLAKKTPGMNWIIPPMSNSRSVCTGFSCGAFGCQNYNCMVFEGFN